MDRISELPKYKTSHSIEMSCLRKCIKWSIAINDTTIPSKNNFYFGEYVFTSNEQNSFSPRLLEFLPINIEQVQIKALENCENKFKFKIEFDLSGINTPFKIVEGYTNNIYEIKIDSNLHKRPFLSDKITFLIKGTHILNCIMNKLTDINKSGLKNKNNKYFCKVLSNINCSLGIDFIVNNE